MKFLWILIVIIIPSCCDIGGESREAVCRHKAAMAALVYSEYYPVRIAYGPADNEEYHSQAQAFINGKWCWLKVSPLQTQVNTDKKDDWFTVITTFDLTTFLNQFWFEKGYGGE